MSYNLTQWEYFIDTCNSNPLIIGGTIAYFLKDEFDITLNSIEIKKIVETCGKLHTLEGLETYLRYSYITNLTHPHDYDKNVFAFFLKLLHDVVLDFKENFSD